MSETVTKTYPRSRIPMRIEPHNGTNIVCGFIFPDKAIKVGQVWQGSGGSRVHVIGTNLTAGGDTWVQYMQSNGVPHEKMSFAFQCRYCLDIGDSQSLTPDVLADIPTWDAMHIGYACRDGEFLYKFDQLPGGVHVKRYKTSAGSCSSPSTVQVLNHRLEFVSVLKLELDLQSNKSFENMEVAKSTVAAMFFEQADDADRAAQPAPSC